MMFIVYEEVFSFVVHNVSMLPTDFYKFDTRLNYLLLALQPPFGNIETVNIFDNYFFDKYILFVNDS